MSPKVRREGKMRKKKKKKRPKSKEDIFEPAPIKKSRGRAVTLLELIMFTVVAGVLVSAIFIYVGYVSESRRSAAFSKELVSFHARLIEFTGNRRRPVVIPSELYHGPSAGGQYSGPVVPASNPKKIGEYFGFDPDVLLNPKNYSHRSKDRISIQAIHEQFGSQQAGRALGAAPSPPPPGGWTEEACRQHQGVYGDGSPATCKMPTDPAVYALWMIFDGLEGEICRRVGRDLVGVSPDVSTDSTTTVSSYFRGGDYRQAETLVTCRVPEQGGNVAPVGLVRFRGYKMDCDACY